MDEELLGPNIPFWLYDKMVKIPPKNVGSQFPTRCLVGMLDFSSHRSQQVWLFYCCYCHFRNRTKPNCRKEDPIQKALVWESAAKIGLQWKSFWIQSLLRSVSNPSES